VIGAQVTNWIESNGVETINIALGTTDLKTNGRMTQRASRRNLKASSKKELFGINISKNIPFNSATDTV